MLAVLPAPLAVLPAPLPGVDPLDVLSAPLPGVDPLDVLSAPLAVVELLRGVVAPLDGLALLGGEVNLSSVSPFEFRCSQVGFSALHAYDFIGVPSAHSTGVPSTLNICRYGR